MTRGVLTRAASSVALAAALLLCPALALATQVTEIRIGNHPTYTRLVFQLDAAAGYGIQHHTAPDGAHEIHVSLAAGAEPRDIASRSVMIERVDIETTPSGTMARIRLKKQPSRVKELILGKPSRVVFDFVFPEADLRRIAARKAAREEAAAAEKQAKSAPVTPAPVTKTAAVPKAKSAAQPKPDAKPPEAKPKVKAEAPKPVEKPKAAVKPKVEPKVKAEAPKPVEKPKAEPKVKAEAPKPVEKPKAEPKVKAEAPKPAAKPEAHPTAKTVKAEAPKPIEKPKPAATPQKPTPAPLRPDRAAGEKPRTAPPAPVAPKPKPAPARPTPTESVENQRGLGEGIDWMTWGGVAAGVIAVLLGVVLFLRRRSLPPDLDVTAMAGADAAAPDAASASVDAGVTEMADDFAIGGDPVEAQYAESATVTEAVPAEHDATRTQSSSGPDIAAGPGLFDDEEKENEMDTESPDLPMERTASEVPTQVGGLGGTSAAGDLGRIVAELERRTAQMEAKLDEHAEARERLERQVAAQAEELRVQRAAIARTQRALRSLNRGEEEQATEPALREPKS